MNATTARQTFDSNWFHEAKASGLSEIDGWGSRSFFEGDRAAWARFVDALKAARATASTTGQKVAATRALQRAQSTLQDFAS